MGGSPKPPKQSDASKEQERLQTSLLKEQFEAAKKPTLMPTIAPVKVTPPPAPPAMEASSDVAEAQAAARRAAGKRTNTAKGTLFAGETGGYLGGKKTLLG